MTPAIQAPETEQTTEDIDMNADQILSEIREANLSYFGWNACF